VNSMRNYSKFLILFFLSFFLFTTVQDTNAQFLKTLVNKVAGKNKKTKTKNKKSIFAEPHEGEFSDESGISGTYYPTSELTTDKKDVKIVKVEYNGKDKLTLYLAKEESAHSVFWIADHHLYALKTYNHYEFGYKRTLNLYSVEPGILVLGAIKRSEEDSDKFIADEATYKPVILAKDTAKMGKYTYEDAKRLIAEGFTAQEKYNRERNTGSTKMADVGDLTSNKELMSECWKTIEGALSAKSDWSGELSNYQMHYIYEKQWGKDPASKVYNPGTKSYDYTRKMISVLAVFKDPKKDELTYYSFTIVKPTEDAVNNYKGFKFNSNSRKQLVSKKTVDTKKAEVGKL
jgi:hypothetical protein